MKIYDYLHIWTFQQIRQTRKSVKGSKQYDFHCISQSFDSLLYFLHSATCHLSTEIG